MLKLWNLAVLLGLVYGLPHLYGLMRPVEFGAVLRRFPRHTPTGWVLMLIATVWFLYNLSQESISDFAAFKPAFYLLFGAVGVGACLYVKDFLAVRGLAVLLLLLAKLMVDTARWVDTEWRLVIVFWAYIYVIIGMWFTISPWRLRDLIDWATANPGRTRVFSAIRLGFGLLVVILGFTVYRAAERKVLGSVAPALWPTQTAAIVKASIPPRLGNFVERTGWQRVNDVFETRCAPIIHRQTDGPEVTRGLGVKAPLWVV